MNDNIPTVAHEEYLLIEINKTPKVIHLDCLPNAQQQAHQQHFGCRRIGSFAKPSKRTYAMHIIIDFPFQRVFLMLSWQAFLKQTQAYRDKLRSDSEYRSQFEGWIADLGRFMSD